MDFTIQSTLRRLCTAKISVPYQPSGRSSHPVRTTCHTVRMPNRPSIIRPNDVHFRPNPPLCREGSIQLASVRTFQHYVRTPLGTRPVSDSFQVSIKERSINRPGDVVSRPNARLLKARIAIQIKRKMSHHSGTTTCRSANIRYTFHNMYLIIRVTSMQWITHNNIINIAEGTSIDNS
jgi:hypothetical protein